MTKMFVHTNFDNKALEVIIDQIITCALVNYKISAHLTTTATRTSPANKSFNDRNNSCARVL